MKWRKDVEATSSHFKRGDEEKKGRNEGFSHTWSACGNNTVYLKQCSPITCPDRVGQKFPCSLYIKIRIILNT